MTAIKCAFCLCSIPFMQLAFWKPSWICSICPICLLNHFVLYSLGTFLLTTLVPLGIIETIRMISNFHFAIKEGKCGFLTFITGSYLAPQNCKVIFDCKSGTTTTVSNVSTFTIKVFFPIVFLLQCSRLLNPSIRLFN